MRILFRDRWCVGSLVVRMFLLEFFVGLADGEEFFGRRGDLGMWYVREGKFEG